MNLTSEDNLDASGAIGTISFCLEVFVELLIPSPTSFPFSYLAVWRR